MILPELPRELFDDIIDHLGGDTSSLKACALTCRTWLARCQFHLYARVRAGEHNRGRLIEIARSSPHLLEYVKQLTWCDQSAENPQGGSLSSWDALQDGAEELLDAIVPLLVQVETLWLLRLTEPPSPAFLSQLARLPPLTCLDINEVTFHDLADLRSLLAALPNLLHLSIQGVFWDSDTGTVGELVPAFELETLVLLAPLSRELLPWLLRSPAVDTLFKLTVSTSPGDLATGEMLRRCEDILYELTLIISPPENSAQPRLLTLTQNTGLISLTIMTGELATLCELLETARSEDLADIFIHLDKELNTSGEWQGREVLLADVVPALEDVVVHGAQYLQGPVREGFKARLADVERRGFLTWNEDIYRRG